MPSYDAATLGQLGYQAYGASTGNRTYDDRPMPTWDGLGETIQGAWIAAAATVAEAHEQTLGAAKALQGPAPTIGGIVHYTLTDADADAIQHRRTEAVTTANMTAAGQTYPAAVVRTFGGPAANLQVLLDGPDTYWATSRTEGEGPGFWAWPPRD